MQWVMICMGCERWCLHTLVGKCCWIESAVSYIVANCSVDVVFTNDYALHLTSRYVGNEGYHSTSWY
jgi:hypothetical protein